MKIKKRISSTKNIEQYDHKGKLRANNPPVGLVTPESDPPEPAKKTYSYDPHLDPQLVWAGKAERLSFEVPTISLHVHERIDPRTIIEAARRRESNGLPLQASLFEAKSENPPLREAIDFYKHPHNWSNRLIAGDSLLVMNSLLEKEGMAGQVQMIYIDPPYGIKYGSNFQPFVNKRDVKDGKDEDLTQEPEMIRAFRDTWELGIHSYLNYLRDRLLLAKELLNESGSCFVQISDINFHHVREIMDEIFGKNNSVNIIEFIKTAGLKSDFLATVNDFILWYAKDIESAKNRYHQLYLSKEIGGEASSQYNWLQLSDGFCRLMNDDEIFGRSELPFRSRIFSHQSAYTAGGANSTDFIMSWDGHKFILPSGQRWRTTKEGMIKLGQADRFLILGKSLRYKRYIDDFPVYPLTELWRDTSISGFAESRRYVVQTNSKVINRCMMMTTNPGDLVLDPTCGSGTTAYMAEQWGRRWITCDTSRIAITLAKQRLMTAAYDYYELAHPQEGVGSGFKYKTVPHVTLKSIANNPEIREGMSREQIDAAITKYADQETLYDQPFVDKSKARVSGPFTVEAVPAPTVRAISEIIEDQAISNYEPAQQIDHIVVPDNSIANSGETLRQEEWRDVLLKGGVRGKGGQHIDFSRVELLGGTRWLHADAETKGAKPERVVISFGPEYAPLEQRQVELALEEARQLFPRPAILLFVYPDIDPEAGKDIAELTSAKTGMTLLSAKIDADVWTKDLKKKARTSPSVWLVGQPDVELRQIKKGDHKGKWEVEVRGFDYFNTSTGMIESGDTSKIAVWLLDTDYDGRSLYPRQVFFPMTGEDEGWARLARNLKAEIDPELIEAYRGTVSLPFESGGHKRVAVKIVDDRGVESLKILNFT